LRDRNSNRPRNSWGEKSEIAEGTGEMESVAPDRPRESEIDRQRRWWRSRWRKNAADLRPGSRKRGWLEELVDQEISRIGRLRRDCRSGRRFAFEGRGV